MPLVEVFVGAFVTVLLEKMASGELLKFLRQVGIESQLKESRSTLLMIEAVLTDAENKQSSTRAVKEWLNNLEDLAYDLDDLVDELNTEALLRTLREKNGGSSSKVRKLIPTCCTNFSPADYLFDRRLDSNLKEISGRLDVLFKQISMLSLVENARGRPYGTVERLQTTSLVVESEVHGRNEDRENIIKMLLNFESNENPITVIPIVGMGGVGKTTLAQLVYNDERLKDKFDLKAWACVSEDFDAQRVTRRILEAVSSRKCDYENFDTLQVKLKESLSKKKFLVVLDDIWNENYRDWDILRHPFLAGERGSKLIITTRLKKVAEIMSKAPVYQLAELSEDDALSLLAQYALGVKSFDTHPDLREIGKFVVRRCRSLPLAVKAIGSLLRTTFGPRDWEQLLKSNIWIDEKKSEVLSALRLSYQYLPPQLKSCFAYCALFPKDYEFDKLRLVHLWMAEGLVQKSDNDIVIERLGIQYFDELLARSFFQQSSANSSQFVMHDLVNDLAVSIAGDKCLRMDDVLEENYTSRIYKQVRHLSFNTYGNYTFPGFDFFNKVQRIRTFLSLPIEQYFSFGYHLPKRILLHLLPKLYHSRVLSLSTYRRYDELPDSIGDLRHLRYLNVAGTRLKCLPESVSNLINLEVLNLRSCKRLRKLPSRMENLINLFNLDLTCTCSLHEMPQGIAQLASLRTLSKIVVSRSSGMRLKDLGKLPFLQGKISIEELQNVLNVQEAVDAKLSEKPALNEISLEWCDNFDDSRSKNLELGVLDALKPHENLSKLEIFYYGGEKLSNWIGNSAFIKLTEITFWFCKWCTSLPPLGQLPLLRKLSINGMDQVKVIGPEFCGSRSCGELYFPSLNSLTFKDMPNWEEWHGIGGSIKLPQLCEFYIRSCPKLVRLPNLLLPSLWELKASECNEVVLNCMHNLETLTNLNLSRIVGLTSVFKAFVHFPFTLEMLQVDDCVDLMNLSPNDTTAHFRVRLQKVCVERCPYLLSLLEVEDLRELTVRNCESLKLLPNAISRVVNLELENCSSLKMVTRTGTSLDHLRELTVRNCTALECVPNLTSCLEELKIWDCPSLKMVTTTSPSLDHLRKLTIWNCGALECLPNLTSCLKELAIENCPSLKMVTSIIQNCYTTLDYLGIDGWANLNLTNLLGSAHNYYNLTRLFIRCCDGLESFPDGGLPTPNLRVLYIRDCQHLKFLPDRIEQLVNLKSLHVNLCPSLMELFPPGNIPPNLRELVIRNSRILKPLEEWNLDKVTTLDCYYLRGYPKLVSFSNNNDDDEQKFVLPPSVTRLWLEDLPNLESLSKGFQNLTSLQHLEIFNCPKLVSLPMEDQIDKLQRLWIEECPLLKERCLKKNRGGYWPIIAEIPHLAIDSNFYNEV